MLQKAIIAPYRKSGHLAFLSGITAPPGDTRTQVAKAFDRVKKRLDELGTSLDNILNVVVYLADLNDRPTALNPVWEEYFPINPPARTTVQVGLAPGVLVELQVVAQLP